MFGQDGIDERMLGVKELKHRLVPAGDIHEEAEGLFVHRLPQLVCEAREPHAVNARRVTAVAATTATRRLMLVFTVVLSEWIRGSSRPSRRCWTAQARLGCCTESVPPSC